MAACGSFGNMGAGDCEGDDCVKIVQTTKQVTVPCTRNVYKTYKVKVPRQVTESKPRTVKWVDYVDQTRQVPYTDYVQEKRIKYQTQTTQHPVHRKITKMIPYTTKEPRTIYVDVTKHRPHTEIKTDMVTRQKQVPITYTVPVPVQKFRTEKYKQPVNKSKVVFDKIQRTVYDTQVKMRCEPKTTMVTKTIPVFNVVSKPPAAPCPPGPGPMPGPMPGPAPAGYQASYGDFNNDGITDAVYMSQRGGGATPYGAGAAAMGESMAGGEAMMGAAGMAEASAGGAAMMASAAMAESSAEAGGMVSALAQPATGPDGMASFSGLSQPATGPDGMMSSAHLSAPQTGPGGVMNVSGLQEPMARHSM